MSLVDQPQPRGQLGVLDVLLVEDDDGDALLVVEHLEDSDLDARVHRATSLAEASDVLRSRSVDCVLLDLGLPDAEGLSALEVILGERSGATVIVLTGLDDDATGHRAVAAGADDYLVKTGVDDLLLAKSMRYAHERRRAIETSLQLFETELRRSENVRLERGLLPTPVLRDGRLVFNTLYRPGGGGAVLGGDFVDLVERPDGTIRLVIGDVCGHGPDEAALGATLRIGWRALVLGGVGDRDVLASLDSLLRSERSTDLFVTVADVTVSADRRRLAYRLAGHWPPVLLTEACEPLPNDRRGFPLGIGRDGWEDHERDLPECWDLILYTDGLVEGHGGDGKLLGLDGLCELLDALDGDLDGERLIAEVEALNGGPITDDVALATLRWRPTGPHVS
jgi:serine phosphatase RsbU (regulator of sigma subunit)